MASPKNFSTRLICTVLLPLIPMTFATAIARTNLTNPTNSTVPDQNQTETQPIRPPPSTNPLSWQSAFWALVALALNNVAQPCGRVLEMPEDWSCVLKASPSAGPLAIAVYIYDTAKHVIEHGSDGFKRTLIATLDSKFSYRSGSADISPVRGRQTSTALRLAFFVLGALPQTIKIFACTSIVGTQLFAACYLIGFVFDEVLIRLDHVYPNSLSSASSHLDMPRGAYLLIFSGSLSFGVKYALSSPTVEQDRLSAALCLIQELCIALPYIVCATQLPTAWLLSPLSMIPASFIFHLALEPLRSGKNDYIVTGSSLIILHYYHVVFAQLFIAIICASMAEDPEDKKSIGVVLFASVELVALVVTALLGYQYLYDPSNTHRPSWTDTLG